MYYLLLSEYSVFLVGRSIVQARHSMQSEVTKYREHVRLHVCSSIFPEGAMGKLSKEYGSSRLWTSSLCRKSVKRQRENGWHFRPVSQFTLLVQGALLEVTSSSKAGLSLTPPLFFDLILCFLDDHSFSLNLPFKSPIFLLLPSSSRSLSVARLLSLFRRL